MDGLECSVRDVDPDVVWDDEEDPDAEDMEEVEEFLDQGTIRMETGDSGINCPNCGRYLIVQRLRVGTTIRGQPFVAVNYVCNPCHIGHLFIYAPTSEPEVQAIHQEGTTKALWLDGEPMTYEQYMM